MGRSAARGCGELGVTPLFQIGISFVMQETGAGKSTGNLVADVGDIQLVSDLHQSGAEIKPGVLPVKAAQARNQGRRNNQNRIGVTERIADQKAGSFLHRRRHEIEVTAQPRQKRGHASSSDLRAASEWGARRNRSSEPFHPHWNRWCRWGSGAGWADRNLCCHPLSYGYAERAGGPSHR